MRKTLMVLGAGHGQLPAIQTAKAKGYRVIATSCYTSDIGMSVADIPLCIDTTDIERSLAAARAYAIDGVMTMATDVAVPSLGKIVAELGLVGPSYHSAMLCTNKLLMKQRLLARGVPTANARFVKTLEAAHAAMRELQLPVMLKAVNSSGSRGITKIEHIGQLEDAFEYARTASHTDTFLVEEFMEGLEFGAQGLVYQGKLQFVFPHNDTVTPPPYMTPIGHSYPMEVSKDVEQQIRNLAVQSVEALEIDNSMLNFDMIMTASGPKIIEVGARMGGTCLPELTSIYSGIDIVDVALEMALGNEPNIQAKETQQPCGAVLIRSAQTGILKDTYVPPDVWSDPRLVAIRWDKQPGEPVKVFKTGPDRIGEIVATADSWNEAEAWCCEIERQVVIKVEQQ